MGDRERGIWSTLRGKWGGGKDTWSRLGLSRIWEIVSGLLVLKHENLLLWVIENKFLVNKHLELKGLLEGKWSHSDHINGSSSPEQTNGRPVWFHDTLETI